MSNSLKLVQDQYQDHDVSKVYMNPAQMRSIIVDANEEYHVLGRGTGKTSGILAYKFKRNTDLMPRSSGFNVAATFQQIMTRTVPSLISGMERLGLVKDIDYVIGKKPDVKLGYIEPFEPPQKREHFMHRKNGAGCHLISQDAKGGSLGLNTAWGFGDEAKLINKEIFDEETLPTMRADRTRYGHLHCWGSLVFTTSMPTKAEGKWILKKREEMDKEQVQLIVMLQMELNRIQLQWPAMSSNQQRLAKTRINKYTAELNELRRTCVYYQEASSLDNIHVLGLDYIRKMKRIMPDFIFRTEILNERPDTVEGCFYPDLDIELHTYTAYNETYLQTLNYDPEKIKNVNCAQDYDLIPDLPLRLGIDWGGKINCLTVAQHIKEPTRCHRFPNTYAFLKGIHVKHPLKLDDLADEFVRYYGPHFNKTVYLGYDHTGASEVANSRMTYIEQFAERIRKKGWTVYVTPNYAPPTHQEKYIMWSRVLKWAEPHMPRVTWNKHNNSDGLTSLMNAPVTEDRHGQIKKDKSSERKDSVPQEEATHYSDAYDINLYSFLRLTFSKKQEFLSHTATE